MEFSDKITLKEIILGVRCKTDGKRITEWLKGDIEVIKAELDTKEFKVKAKQ